MVEPDAPWIARNVAGLKLSAIKEMAMLSARTAGALSLAWGLPSFQTPLHIRNYVTERLASDAAAGMYTLPDGLIELRELVAAHHANEFHCALDPDEHVMISAGNMQALNTILHVILEPDDEIILTDPGFASHFQQIRISRGRPVCWRLLEENGWSLDLEALANLVSPRTKAIVLVSPSNPTGKIFAREELLAVAEIARSRRLLVVVDDPYRHFTYENRSKYFNLASDEAFRDHVVYCFSFSKAYAMSGWRLGYMIMPPQVKRQALKIHDATMICAPRIAQLAGIAALEGPPDHLAEFEKVLEARRDLIRERLDRLPHVFDYVKPEGAYYVFPRICAPHTDSVEFSRRLLSEAKVTVTPGSAFGPSGEHHVRMAFCVSEQVIDKAFDRIEAFFGS